MGNICSSKSSEEIIRDTIKDSKWYKKYKTPETRDANAKEIDSFLSKCREEHRNVIARQVTDPKNANLLAKELEKNDLMMSFEKIKTTMGDMLIEHYAPEVLNIPKTDSETFQCPEWILQQRQMFSPIRNDGKCITEMRPVEIRAIIRQIIDRRSAGAGHRLGTGSAADKGRPLHQQPRFLGRPLQESPPPPGPRKEPPGSGPTTLGPKQTGVQVRTARGGWPSNIHTLSGRRLANLTSGLPVSSSTGLPAVMLTILLGILVYYFAFRRCLPRRHNKRRYREEPEPIEPEDYDYTQITRIV